ncbi:Os01g0946600, partial [Oryza sativa Japonica Group]
QRPGLLAERHHPVHRRRQRARPRRHGDHPPGHAERVRRARVRRPLEQHQGVDGGEDGRDHRLVPSVARRVPPGPAAVHGAHRAVPRQHHVAAARQRVPLLCLQGQPARHPAQLRHVPAGHHGEGQRQRPHLHQPLQRHGGRRVRRAGEGRRARRPRRRVGERVAVGGRVRGERGEREESQPGRDRQRQERDAEAARAAGDVRVRHVQREPEARG